MKLVRQQGARGASLLELAVALGVMGILLSSAAGLLSVGLNVSRKARLETSQELLTKAVQHRLRDTRERITSNTAFYFDRAFRAVDSAKASAWTAELTLLPGLGWESPHLQTVRVQYRLSASGQSVGSVVLQRHLPAVP